MARLAGEVADVAICWLTPASYVEDVLVPALEKGAERAGRPVPRLVVMVPLAVDRPGRDPVALARTPHVNFPHYQDMLRRAGVSVDEDDADVTLRSMIENEVFLFGSPAAIAKQIDEYREVGVDEVVLYTTGVALRENGCASVTEFEALLREVRSWAADLRHWSKMCPVVTDDPSSGSNAYSWWAPVRSACPNSRSGSVGSTSATRSWMCGWRSPAVRNASSLVPRWPHVRTTTSSWTRGLTRAWPRRAMSSWPIGPRPSWSTQPR